MPWDLGSFDRPICQTNKACHKNKQMQAINVPAKIYSRCCLLCQPTAEKANKSDDLENYLDQYSLQTG